MENFDSLDLPLPLMEALAKISFTVPTPIQAQAIPPALEGRDILGSAQTGTGKTGAFGIPLVAHLINNPDDTALVLTPTRELAVQVLKTLESFLGKNSRINTALLIGGDAMFKQMQQLKRRPRLIVGTPGRIDDHLSRGSLYLDDTRFLVLDETDRMLDMGFSIQIEQILEYVPQNRQTLLFSATLPKNIMTIVQKYMNDPLRIAAGEVSVAAPQIKQEILEVSENQKYDTLLSQLEQREGSVIVFVKTKSGVERIAEKLADDSHSVDALHGDLRHTKRERVINAFRNRKHRIMIATDVAARGLDIPHIAHVINYDLPQCPEDYIHRIGRTGRAGATGEALCLITPSDRQKWNAIYRLMNPQDKTVPLPRGTGAPSGRSGRSGSGSGYGGGKPRRPHSSSDSARGYAPREGREDRGGDGGYAPRRDRSDKAERFSSDRPKRSFGERGLGERGKFERSPSSARPAHSSQGGSRGGRGFASAPRAARG